MADSFVPFTLFEMVKSIPAPINRYLLSFLSTYIHEQDENSISIPRVVDRKFNV
jgi:hypothetical protein